MEESLKQLHSVLISALKENGANEFTYEWEWVYDLPGQCIKINDKMIDYQYSLPQQYSEQELNQLAELGHFEKIQEQRNGKPFYEVVITYRLK